MAEQPSSRSAACAARPRTTPLKVSAPAWAHTTVRPLGSGSSAASNAASRSSAAKVPRPPSSSEPTACSTTVGTSAAPAARSAASACRAAATPPFMSSAPRPYSRPSSTVPDQGPCRHGTVPGPTTSTCPLRHRRPDAAPSSVAVAPHSSVRGASSPGWPGCARRAARSCSCRSAARPARAASSAKRSSAGRSSAVTLGTRTSAAASRTSASASRASSAASSIARRDCTRAACRVLDVLLARGDGQRRIIVEMGRLPGPVIEVRSLERRFGPRAVLDRVDLAVHAGEVHGVLGPAGAGKTTLLRVLAGVIAPSGGEARVLGRPGGDHALRGRVGLVSVEDGAAYPRISGLENLAFSARLHGMGHRAAEERGRAVLRAAGLARAGDGPIAEWSSGMRVRLAFARALLTEPDVLLVDAAPAHTADVVRGLVAGRARAGTTVVWATGRLDDLRGVASGVTLLAGGRVRYAGSVEALVLRALAVSVEDVADRLAHAA